MNLNVREEDGARIIALDGRLELTTGKELKEKIKTFCDSGTTRIHVNMEQVEFINSSGLGALISAMKEVRLVKGRLTLSNLAPYVREIFDITQLAHIFEIHETEKAAFASSESVTVSQR